MKKKDNTLAYTPKNKLPKLGKVQTNWNLKDLFYTRDNDPRIEKDMQKAERACTAFAKKYRGKSFTSTSSHLRKALDDYQKLESMPEFVRPSRYFGFRHELDAKDSVAEKRGNLLEARMTKAINELLFFLLEVGKIPAKKQKEYLKDKNLEPYHYYLARVFLEAKHTLSESEERIVNLYANTSSYMWVSGTSKIVSNRTITWNKKEIAIPEALERIDLEKPAQKQKLWDRILDEFEQIAEVAENEFNAIVTHKKVSDELRGYKEPYSATIQRYENDEKSVLALVDAISTKGFALSRKFYKLKAEYHGKKSLPYANRSDSIGNLPEVSFEQAMEICRDTFYGLKKEYGEIFDRMLTTGQVDVYPKKGKRGGAFMAATVNLPTFVFLNHVDNLKSLETLAHEIGHAIHAERSKVQPTQYQDFSTVTAETASTLFEQLVEDRILEQVSDKDKIILLHDRIGRDIATIQRQIAFFNFERELHTSVRQNGAVTKEELQKMIQKNFRAYLGSGIEMTERDGLSYIYIPHFRYGFYVYSYAYGILVSSIMARKLRKDPSYIEKIDTFLSAGGNDTVENIFKSIGIDTTKEETFLESLASLEEDIKTFEKLVKKK